MKYRNKFDLTFRLLHFLTYIIEILYVWHKQYFRGLKARTFYGQRAMEERSRKPSAGEAIE